MRLLGALRGRLTGLRWSQLPPAAAWDILGVGIYILEMGKAVKSGLDSLLCGRLKK